MNKTIIFIGDRPTQHEMQIKSKPKFSDAMLLSKKANLSSMKKYYHSIPINQDKLSFHFKEINSHFIFSQHTLELVVGDHKLTEEEVYDIFSNFAFMADNKVSILILDGMKKIRKGSRNKLKVLQEEVKL